MCGIQVAGISKMMKLSSRKVERLFDDFSLSVPAGETLGIFGPNGCGKTTLFNMISGILRPDTGEIRIHGKVPQKNNIAYIFQDYRNSLFPWFNVRENIVFPLKIRKAPKEEVERRLGTILELTGVKLDLTKYPYQLSGGMQQYVAILRGLIAEPDVLLVDEPFSALDYANAMWLMEKIHDVKRKVNIPSLLVSHDIEHLVYLSDRIVFFSQKPTRILAERTVEHAEAGSGMRFNRAFLERLRRDAREMYRHDPSLMAMGI